MKTLHTSVLVLAACFSAAGCQGTLHADSPVLNGPVPRCKVLLSEARTAYREEAKKECDAAQTPEERKKSGGCAVIEYMTYCTP